MLLSFSIENWMSFRDRVTFSMVASRERQHGLRVPKLGKYQTKVLPIAAIYGGNASGKTNFFQALNFAKQLVITITQPGHSIRVKPFKLDAQSTDRPSSFTFELLIDECIYELHFAVTREAVLEEKLTKITSTKEDVLYNRRDGQPHFNDKLAKDDALKFAFRGTRDNQLFLTNSVSQKLDHFLPIYNWFKDTLRLIAANSMIGDFGHLFDKSRNLYAKMKKLLPQLDTGISRLAAEAISFKKIFDNDGISEQGKARITEDIQGTLAEGESCRYYNRSRQPFIVTRKKGELIASKLVTYHHSHVDNKDIPFHMQQESDGTRRLIDLLPTFLTLCTQDTPSVLVIDEIDRSLHTLLTRTLLESYLDDCSPTTRTQLLLTTHDVLLMDQQLLRRDEMWVAERDSEGASKLLSFSEYKDARYDKDIRKSYLQGRLGGIPEFYCETF